MRYDIDYFANEGDLLSDAPISSRRILKFVEGWGTIGFWSHDIATGKIWGSPGLYRMLGLPPATDLCGVPRRLVHPDDAAAQSDLPDLLLGGHPLDREFRILRRDDTVRWVAMKVEVVYGPDAKPARADGVLFDTTAVHAARQVAERMQARHAGILRAVAAAIWVACPGGEIEMGAGWDSLTGQTPSEIAGTGWLDALHPDDRAVTLAAWHAARTAREPVRASYRIRGPDGAYRRCSGRATPQFNADGSVREWFGLVLAVPDDTRGTVPDALIGPLIRGARAILGWSIEDLAAASGVSGSSVRRMEEFGEAPRPKIRLAVRRTFEAAGVRFASVGPDRVAIEIDPRRLPRD